MKLIAVVLTVLMSGAMAIGQSFSTQDPSYIEHVTAGEAALNNGEYDLCLEHYGEAFKIQQTSYLSTMRMAACAFLSDQQGICEQQLDIAFALDWSGPKQILSNYPEFAPLRTTAFAKDVNARWEIAAEEAGINLALMTELEEILRKDQMHRQQIDQYEWGSPQMDSLIQLMVHQDSVNTARITEMIDEHGYPGESLVGQAQSTTAFLIIQHAELEVQERYLEIITDAADSGEVAWSAVALLIDRVNLRKGKKQIYGSQVQSDSTGVHFFSPIEQPYQVDSIRATVGLGPIQDYADKWGIKWDPDAHLARHDTEKVHKH